MATAFQHGLGHMGHWVFAEIDTPNISLQSCGQSFSMPIAKWVRSKFVYGITSPISRTGVDGFTLQLPKKSTHHPIGYCLSRTFARNKTYHSKPLYRARSTYATPSSTAHPKLEPPTTLTRTRRRGTHTPVPRGPDTPVSSPGDDQLQHSKLHLSNATEHTP